MAMKDNIKEMLKESFPEMLFAAKACIDFRKTDKVWEPNDGNGCLGYPSSIILFCIVDAIGSYCRDNDSLEIMIGTSKEKIKNSEEHFYILNSKYYNQNLSLEHIKTIYGEYRSHLVHNLAMPGQHILNIGNESDKVFDLKSKKQGGKFPFINLKPFYLVSEKAVCMFLSDLDSIPYEENYWIKKIQKKDVEIKSVYNELFLVTSGTTTLPTEPLQERDGFPSGTNSSGYITVDRKK